MDALLGIALVLGIIEGLTEFLPVSSTGHLILAGHALGFTGEAADIFEVAIQSGAMLAVVVLYWPRFWGLLRPSSSHGFQGPRGIALIVLTSLPALAIGALVHGYIKRHLFNPTTVAIGLAVGAVAIWVVESLPLKARTTNLDELTWKQALGVGLCQCLAMWPGMSRSASTILGGMGLGLTRATAAEYSFFAAVPIICAATVLDLYKGIKGDLLHASDIPHFTVGLVVSFVSAWLAIKGFIRLVQTNTLRPFAIYRIILAAAVLLSPGAFK